MIRGLVKPRGGRDLFALAFTRAELLEILDEKRILIAMGKAIGSETDVMLLLGLADTDGESESLIIRKTGAVLERKRHDFVPDRVFPAGTPRIFR